MAIFLFILQLYIDPQKLLPLKRFLPQPPGSVQKRGGRGRGGGGRGGRGGRGGGGGGFRGRGGGGGGRGGFGLFNDCCLQQQKGRRM